MELKEFIATSLKSIIEGVMEAQRHAGSVGAFVNPQDANASTAGSSKSTVRRTQITGSGIFYFEISEIEFDLAVTISSSAENKGGIGVLASIVAIGGSKASEKSSETVSRLKFSVPVAFPHQPKASPR